MRRLTRDEYLSESMIGFVMRVMGIGREKAVAHAEGGWPSGARQMP